MTKEKIENKLFWHYLSGGVLALIWICIEIDIYPVRNTEETIKKGTVVHRA